MLRRLSRKLQSSLLVEYEIIIDAICSSSDCSDAQTLANKVYEEVTGDLLDAIQDGTIVSSLQQTSTALATLLQNASATGDFSEVVVPILALLASYWYPHWQGQTNTCKNDGNEPTYMKIFQTYYEPSLDACCERYFSWDIYECNGNAITAPIGFYPNGGKTEHKCLNATETASTIPDYMLNNPEQWLDSDIEMCCERHYNWEYNDCVSQSGGSSSSTATGEWYVNHEGQICQQDCLKEVNATCGGLVQAWDTLYSTASDCCAEKLSWIASARCESRSTLTTEVGSSEWYVDWSTEQCVKDCNDKSDVDCGGFAKNWDEFFASSSDCCDRLWYIERDECTSG